MARRNHLGVVILALEAENEREVLGDARIAAGCGGTFQQCLGPVRTAVHGVGERQVAEHRGLIGGKCQGAFVERDGGAVVTLLGQHGAAR